MSTKANRVTESELSQIVLQILADSSNGEATVAQLKKEIPKRIQLSDADRQDSETRPGEELWEQQVRNITSHKKTPGNIIYEGFAEPIESGLRITSAGIAHVQSK